MNRLQNLAGRLWRRLDLVGDDPWPAAGSDWSALASAGARATAPPATRAWTVIERTVCEATGQPDQYLAAALVAWSDAALARAVGCAPGAVWRLRLCGWPRATQWDEDVEALAAGLAADPERLGRFLLLLDLCARVQAV